MKQLSFWVLVLSAVMVSPAVAQQTVSPAKGQSPEQQQNDEVDCYNWAISQTGFDPAAQASTSAGLSTTDDRDRHHTGRRSTWRGAGGSSG